MYHYVRDLKHSRYPKIKGLEADLFKEQLQYILRHYEVITMQDVFMVLRGRKKPQDNALLLTFDDGYKDHFDIVFPVLDSLGIQGSFFPPAKAIQECTVLDVNKIHFILASLEDEKRLVFDIFSLLDKYRDQYGLEPNDTCYSRLAKNDGLDIPEVVFVKRLLQKGLPEEPRSMIIDELFSKYVTSDEQAFSRQLYMNTDELKWMLRHGMYIGSHGWGHYWLNTFSKDRQANEVCLSLQFLQSLGCDTSVWAMSYPYGAYDDSLISILKAYGCIIAFIDEDGLVDLSSDDPFTFPRLDTNSLPKDKNAKPNEWTAKVANYF